MASVPSDDPVALGLDHTLDGVADLPAYIQVKKVSQVQSSWRTERLRESNSRLAYRDGLPEGLFGGPDQVERGGVDVSDWVL